MQKRPSSKLVVRCFFCPLWQVGDVNAKYAEQTKHGNHATSEYSGKPSQSAEKVVNYTKSNQYDPYNDLKYTAVSICNCH